MIHFFSSNGGSESSVLFESSLSYDLVSSFSLWVFSYLNSKNIISDGFS
jgi:hypothetical protein